MNESLLPAWPSFECCGYKGKQVKSPCLLEVDVQVELDDKQIDTEYNINVRTREKWSRVREQTVRAVLMEVHVLSWRRQLWVGGLWDGPRDPHLLVVLPVYNPLPPGGSWTHFSQTEQGKHGGAVTAEMGYEDSASILLSPSFPDLLLWEKPAALEQGSTTWASLEINHPHSGVAKLQPRWCLDCRLARSPESDSSTLAPIRFLSCWVLGQFVTQQWVTDTVVKDGLSKYSGKTQPGEDPGKRGWRSQGQAPRPRDGMLQANLKEMGRPERPVVPAGHVARRNRQELRG